MTTYWYTRAASRTAGAPWGRTLHAGPVLLWPHLRLVGQCLATGMVLLAVFAIGAARASAQQKPAAPENQPATEKRPASSPPDAKSNHGEPSAEEPAVVRLGHLNPPDRATLRLLSGAEELLRLGRDAEAVRCLGQILANSEDYLFQPRRSSANVQSLKAEAEQLLRNTGSRGLDLYELQFGVRAAQMLRQGVDHGDLSMVGNVARQFFLSAAGQEATYLLGLYHLHAGRPELAALYFDRLRQEGPLADRFEPALSLLLAASQYRNGRPDSARKVLLELKRRIDGGRLPVDRAAIADLDLSDDPLEWLNRQLRISEGGGTAAEIGWLMFRGSAARNPPPGGGAPLLSVRWRVPTTDQPYLAVLIRELETSDRVQGHARITALHPVAARGVVLMRTTRSLLAVDMRTGKRIWDVPSDDRFEQMIGRGQGVAPQPLPQLGAALRVQLWDHATYGRLSSDGQRVYAVESSQPEVLPVPFHPLVLNHRAGQMLSQLVNRLAAYDIGTGKLQWHLGEAESNSQHSDLGNVYYLGPPLPLAGRLYVLARREGEIRLLVLRSDSGELLWSQQLGRIDTGGLPNTQSRFDGLSPSYGNGLLVCPLPNRCIVAVDLVTRQLRWAYTYQVNRPDRMNDPFSMALVRDESESRWCDWGAVVAEGCVLVTPGDSRFLHCLKLSTGELLWKEPRRDDLYLACVYRGKAVLVGPRQVRAVQLHQVREPKQPGAATAPKSSNEARAPLDCAPEEALVAAESPAPSPEAAWNGHDVPLPAGTMTNGYGFLAGNRYWVPLDDGSIAAVNLDSGQMAEHWKGRQSHPLGNLVCVGGIILSQTPDGLTAYPQLKVLQEQVAQRLAANPTDYRALVDQGEIFLQQGRLGEAVASFRKAAAEDPTPRSRQLLGQAMLEALEAEFPTHRQWAPQLEQLLQEPEQQARFLRLMASGNRELGNFRESMEYLVRLIELDRTSPGLETIDGALSIRRDHWIAGQLASLYQQAPEPVREKLDRLASEQLRRALAEEDPDALRRLCRYFAELPAAAEAHDQFTKHLEQAERWIELEHLLWSDVDQGDARRRGDSVLALAGVFQQLQRWTDVAATARWIADHTSDVSFSGDRSGAEVAAQLAGDEKVTPWTAPLGVWLPGAVHAVEKGPEHVALGAFDRTTIPVSAGADPYWAGWQLEIGLNPPVLLARDCFGRTAWSISLKEFARGNRFSLSRSLTSAVTMGHLLFVTNGERLLAIDTLATETKLPGHHGSARILWSRSVRNLQFENESAGGTMGVSPRASDLFLPANLPMLPEELTTRPIPLGTKVLCIKQLHRCVALDPLSGETVWVRSDLLPDSVLVGDSEYLLAISAERGKVTVYRTSDGTRLGTRPLPEGVLWDIDGTLVPDGPERSFHLASFGRYVLCWRLDGSEARLLLADVWADRTAWKSPPLDPASMMKLVGQSEVAVFEPAGRFRLFRLPEGQTVISISLPDDPALDEMMVIASPWQYLVMLLNTQPGGLMAPRTYHMHGSAAQRIYRAKLFAFDRQGKPMWPRPVTVTHQWLPLDQPAGVPVLTFACIVQQPRVLGQRRRAETAVLCLDRRTGREVFNRRFDTPGTRLDVIGDPESQTVRLMLQQQTVELQFTDEPIVEPRSMFDIDGNSVPGMVLKALMKEAEKAINPSDKP